jgi:glutamine synthetase
VAWSRRNRSALIRVPLYHPGKENATRAEIRCPDPSCNPYLAFAGLLHAGLEGIEQGYELPDPMETNLYELTKQERRALDIESLPESLGDAIDTAAESDLVERALGTELRDRLISLKQREWDEYRVQVTPWELERYLPTL